ncbi:MAG: MBL fold metallo-hydrolase, partial [Methanoregula sp.]|nr:MBL fold metallo-hydrolase [Methanoregula sp.]
SEESYTQITQDLEQIGYLQNSIRPLSFLKFCVYLPHRPGALYDFLGLTTGACANISFLDFDDKGRHPDRLTVSLNLEQGVIVGRLLDLLKSLYRLEIIEYDTTGDKLDDTVFYVRYAQAIRELIGESEDHFLLSFLADTNHMAQELMDRGKDPKKVFESVLASGRTMRATSGRNFYADVQKFAVDNHTTLFCFQVPCGGNIFVIKSDENLLLIDTGYGIYHADIMAMLSRYGMGDINKIRCIVVTHADADHCGGAGFFPAPALMHNSTLEIIRTNNRAYGSRSDHASLDEFYTKMINLFSKFNIPKTTECLAGPGDKNRGIFPVIGRITIGDVDLEILDGFNGHTAGQVFLYSRTYGLLFAADSVINFASLSQERADYSSLAAFLVTSVNVDSGNAKKERTGLLELAHETDTFLASSGRRCMICGGHGAVSVLDGGKLVAIGDIERYIP